MSSSYSRFVLSQSWVYFWVRFSVFSTRPFLRRRRHPWQQKADRSSVPSAFHYMFDLPQRTPETHRWSTTAPCTANNSSFFIYVSLTLSTDPASSPCGLHVERIARLRFLARCCKRWLNQALSVLSLSIGFFWSSECALCCWLGPIWLCYIILFVFVLSLGCSC